MRTILVRNLISIEAVTTVLTFYMIDGSTRTITGYEDIDATEEAGREYNQLLAKGDKTLLI